MLAWIPYFTAGGSTIERLPIVNNRVLALEGIEFDKINTVERTLRHASGPILGRDDGDTLASILRNMYERGVRGQTYPTGETLEGVISMVLTAGLRSANYRYLTTEQHLADFHSFCVSILQLSIDRGPEREQTTTISSRQHDAARYLNALQRVSINRRFFETSQHYLGIGPQSMQSGDLVCVILGARTPVVLRPLIEVDGAYELLGDCYVHGIMFGEAMDVVKKNTLKIFELK